MTLHPLQLLGLAGSCAIAALAVSSSFNSKERPGDRVAAGCIAALCLFLALLVSETITCNIGAGG